MQGVVSVVSGIALLLFGSEAETEDAKAGQLKVVFDENIVYTND